MHNKLSLINKKYISLPPPPPPPQAQKKLLAFGSATTAQSTTTTSSVWTATTTGLTSALYAGGVGSVYFGNGKWMVGGGTFGDTTNPNVYYSTNLGGSWTAISGSSTTIGGLCYCIAFGPDPTNGGNVWLAGGGTSGAHKISYLTDTAVTTGGAWTGIYSNNVNINLRVYCVAYGGGLWVAGGYGNINTLMYSTNPTKQNFWIGVSNSATVIFPTSGVAGQCRGLAYGNGLWVAVGSSGSSGGNTIATSPNGMNWTVVTNSTNYISGVGNGVAYGLDNTGAGIWVAVGTGTNKIVYSYNPAVSWTGVANSSTIFTTTCNSVTYTGGMWIAVGQGGNTMATSVDGKTWTGLGASSPFGTANIGLSVAGEP
jgi:hypothetical protein